MHSEPNELESRQWHITRNSLLFPRLFLSTLRIIKLIKIPSLIKSLAHFSKIQAHVSTLTTTYFYPLPLLFLLLLLLLVIEKKKTHTDSKNTNSSLFSQLPTSQKTHNTHSDYTLEHQKDSVFNNPKDQEHTEN